MQQTSLAPAAAPLETTSLTDRLVVYDQFPILRTRAHGQPLVYLDSAASTQQPEAVIAAVSAYHQRQHANIHRGAYALSQAATRLYEDARQQVARFLNAAESAECLFTRGTTESINLVAATWGRDQLGPGDEILLSALEHHSNIVPWQMVAAPPGAVIKVIPVNDAGELLLDAYAQLLSPRTRLVAVNQVSNALGTINPVAEIIAMAHAQGALVLIDGAQWVAHGPTDVQALDADFYAFSGHKLYGPTGIGVLYGKRRLLEVMSPWQGGGDMIERVTFAHTTYADIPNRFEAGTPNISGAIGLGAAIAWLQRTGVAAISAHEKALLDYATGRLSAIPGLIIKGTARHKAGVISFMLTDPPIATLDIGTQLDLQGICIRTGHHCCQPLMERLGVAGTARASFGVYTRREDIDRLVTALGQIVADARAGARSPAIAGSAPMAAPLGFPSAAAPSPAAAALAIAEDFSLLSDWPMRHEHLIDLGDRLPVFPVELKTAANLVRGCQSQVWLVARRRPGGADVIEFIADSDASIVRGLIALLETLYSGQTAAAILAFDADAFFAGLGLDQHLSLNRRNGLASMVQRLRAQAQRYPG